MANPFTSVFQGVLPLLTRDLCLFDTDLFLFRFDLNHLFYRTAESDSGSDSSSSEEEEKQIEESKADSDDEPKQESEA